MLLMWSLCQLKPLFAGRHNLNTYALIATE
jgi:hypothetical protein